MELLGKSELYLLRKRIIDKERDIRIVELDLECCKQRIEQLKALTPNTDKFRYRLAQLFNANASEKKEKMKLLAHENLLLEAMLTEERNLINKGKIL